MCYFALFDPGGDQETSRDTAGSPRNARAKQVWMRWEGRSRAMDLEEETEEVLDMRREEIDVARVGGD